MGILKEIGDRYGTDKGDQNHQFNGISYLDVYEQYFSPLRYEDINILEIGVSRGLSLKTWKEYFPNANIFGMDIDSDCKQHEDERISIEIGSQVDKNALQNISDKANGEFDIIIDDGSHVNKYTLESFNFLFQKVKKGGIYAIEDLRQSYIELDKIGPDGLPTEGGQGVRHFWAGMKYNPVTDSLDNNREDMSNFFENIIRDIDHQQGQIQSIQFWSMMCFILKTK